jgi:hypothetical protein
MIGLTLRQAKGSFFDRPRVMGAVNAAERKVLSRFGAFVRQRARSSIRRRSDPSPPGSPPSSHVGLLRQFILFTWDPTHRSVVIGPTKLNAKGDEAPRLLEYGGTTFRRRFGKIVRVRYAPRPFMNPSFTTEIKSLPALWRNSVR